jgi:hypothetical protein
MQFLPAAGEWQFYITGRTVPSEYRSTLSETKNLSAYTPYLPLVLKLTSFSIGVLRHSEYKCISTLLLLGPSSLLSNGYRGSFPGGKARPDGDADHSTHLVLGSRMSKNYSSSPPQRLHGV